jgi:hypothetical protein
LNNLAELYKVMNEKNKAMVYIEEALCLIKNENTTDRMLIYLTTKLEIVEDINESKSLIKEIEYILLSDLKSFNKKFIITSINTLIDVVENINDKEINMSLISMVNNIINTFKQNFNNKNSNYIHDNFIRLLENNRNKLIYINNR